MEIDRGQVSLGVIDKVLLHGGILIQIEAFIEAITIELVLVTLR